VVALGVTRDKELRKDSQRCISMHRWYYTYHLVRLV